MVRNITALIFTLALAACGGEDRAGLDGGPEGFAPTLSVDGVAVGLQPVVVEVDENTVGVASIATTGGTLSLSAADDGALFTLGDDGKLAFIEAPDYENPGGDGTNTYVVRVDALGNLSASVTLSVQVQDVSEGQDITGRVIDGPVAGAAVYADLNCNAVQDEDEPFGTTDDAGFFALNTESVIEDCAKFFSIGGTDIATGKALLNIQLSADLPADLSKPAAVTPLTTIIAAATTPEAKAAVLTALGITEITVEELLTTDVWAASESADDQTTEGGIAAAALAQQIQRVNTQIATIIKVATSLASTTQTGAGTTASLAAAVQAVSEAIVAQSVSAVAESAASGAVVRVNLASASVVQSVIETTVKAVAKAAAIAAGRTEAEAEVLASAQVAQIASVIVATAAKVEIVNTAAADASVNPTSALGIAVAAAAETQVVEAVTTVVAAIKAVIDGGGDVAEIAAIVAAQAAVVEAITADTIFEEIINTIEDLPDFDGDGIPDVTDPDDDNDGVPDVSDAFPKDEDESVDTDGDGIGNNADPDDDNDGVLDVNDAFPLNANESADTDSDGIGDNGDNCPLASNPDQADADGNGVGDACEPPTGGTDTDDKDPDGSGSDDADDTDDKDPDGSGSDGPVADTDVESFDLYRVGIADYIDQGSQTVVYGLIPSLSNGGLLTMEIDDNNVIDASNLQSVVDGDPGTGIAPKMVLLLDEIPPDGASGSLTATLTLLEDNDDDQVLTSGSGERQLTAEVGLNWSSDGSDIMIEVAESAPAMLTYEREGSLVALVELDGANGAADMVTLSESSAYSSYPATIEIRALDFFQSVVDEQAEAVQARFEDFDPASFFGAGDSFYVAVELQGVDNLYYQGSETLVTSLETRLTLGEVEDPLDSFDIVVDDWTSDADVINESGFGIDACYPYDELCHPATDTDMDHRTIRLYPMVVGEALSFDFGPHQALSLTHINELLDGTLSEEERVPALRFELSNIPAAGDSGDFTITMTLTSGEDGGEPDAGEVQMTSTVNVSYMTYTGPDGDSAEFTVPDLTRTVTITFGDGGSVCTTGCTFTLASADDQILELTDRGPMYPPTMSTKLINFFDLSDPRTTESAEVSIEAGVYHLHIEISEEADGLLSYGGLPINEVKGLLRIE